MKTFFISDTHFNHANILKYNPNRNFSTVEEMNEGLIKNWNEKVSANDWVYHLGDFAFGNLPIVLPILKRLNGTKVLIQGNHDKDMLKHAKFKDCWEFITKYHELVVDDIKLVLFHYPLESWQDIFEGSYHFHGHSHSTGLSILPYKKARRIDVGVDASNLYPWTLQEIMEYDKITLKQSLLNTVYSS